jgi:L-ascorbate metabolism protein UlaG (beta-lactamase superfamily)
VTSSKPNPEHHEQLPLAHRLTLIGHGFRSMIKRYPRDLASAVRRTTKGTRRAGEPFADQWKHAIEKAAPTDIVAAWLGHCTVLLRVDGKTIVTDPVLSERIGMKVGGVTVGPMRLNEVPVPPDALPPIDLVLISHAHFDHLDRDTLKHLATKRTEVLTASNTRGLIPRGFAHIHELRWDHTTDLLGLEFKALKPAHWGARKVYDRHRAFNSYTISTLPPAHAPGNFVSRRILFAGDTALTKAFDKAGPFDLGIFGIGAYNPWHDAHATPEQVWTMAQRAGVKRIMPVHHSTFKLSDEPIEEPLQRLLKAADLHDGKKDGDPEGMRAVMDVETGQIVRIA